jgi:hypothetical protein
MKIRISMKTPDCIDRAIDELEPSDHEAEDIRRISKRFFRYEEYVELEIDTETETCIVVPKG